MADQDFNIKVVTTADTTGINQVDAGLDKIARRQAEAEAKWARSPINPKNQTAAGGGGIASLGGGPIPPGGGGGTAGGGLTGTAVGLGTIVTLLTRALSQWKEFNAEQDRWVDGMIKAEEKARSLGLAIVDMQDKARSAARIDFEPLEQSFTRLAHDAAVLKTEIQLAFESGNYEDVKKLQSDLNIVDAQLKRVTDSLAKQKAEAQKAAQSELEKRVPGLKPEDQVKEADAQTQRILQNEQAAAKARAEGNDKDAEMFQRSADQYKASATPKQLADLQRIHDLQNQLNPAAPVTPYRQPQPGEPGGGETGTGGEYRKSAAQLRADQLENRQARESGIKDTRDESTKAMADRLAEILTLQREMLGIWR